MLITIISAIGLVLFTALIGYVIACGTMGHYRIYYYSGKTGDDWIIRGYRDSPWKWLAIRRAKKLIKHDTSIERVVVEDISNLFWSDVFCYGKTVWEWERDGGSNK